MNHATRLLRARPQELKQSNVVSRTARVPTGHFRDYSVAGLYLRKVTQFPQT
jgi:hypothetical protein